MTNTLFNLLFLITQGKSFKKPNRQEMPKESNFINSNQDDIKKAINQMKGSFGDIFKGDNLNAISNLIETFAKGNTKLKIGHLIVKLAEHAIDSLVHDGQSNLAISHSNESTKNSEITIERTHVYIGKKHNNRIKTHLNGPTYEKFSKCILDTQKDCLETKRRKQLNSKSGVNQRGFTFLEKDTFLTFKDIEELANYRENKTKVKEEMERLLKLKKGTQSQILEEISNNLKSLKSREEDGTKHKYYSALLSTKTELKLMNRMPVYDLNIIVHLVKFRNFDSKITTVKELIKDLKASTAEEIRNKRYLDRIKQKDIKQELESEEFKFSRQLITSLNVNITNLESFQKNCILVNSWRRTISSGGHWYITINEKFQDGIYLNKFHELVEDKIDMDTPMNSFLLIEYFGDNRASVFREADEQTISSVYSPCYISYEMKLNITHVSNIKSPDEILCYSKLKKTDEFEDESLQMDFYPTREEKFNINFDDIKIGDEKNKKNAKYKLEMNASILENQTLSRFDEMINRISKVNPTEAETITPDDLNFFSNQTDVETKNDNLRGNKKPLSEDEI
jgi:hypothetical protein